jgi:anaerobic selenocysteine-containing dehydrogenase
MKQPIFMPAEDARQLKLKEGAPIMLRNAQGEFRGHVKIDRIKPGFLQAHWPEVNVIVPAGRLDPSSVPDSNAEVEVIAGDKREPRAAGTA